MSDAIDELVARSKDHRELRAFHAFHRKHPEVLDFLVQEIRMHLELFDAFSYHSLWQYGRWKLEMEKGPGDTFLMNDHAAPFYARAITILHPEFNRRAEFRKSKADEILGVRIESDEYVTQGYARGLEWADGIPLELGWRPTIPHTTGSVLRKPDIHENRKLKLKLDWSRLKHTLQLFQTFPEIIQHLSDFPQSFSKFFRFNTDSASGTADILVTIEPTEFLNKLMLAIRAGDRNVSRLIELQHESISSGPDTTVASGVKDDN